jgi:hypothetical protein
MCGGFYRQFCGLARNPMRPIMQWSNHGGFMLRLIKLAVYAGAAYALYEVVQGMLADSSPRRATGGSRELQRALNEDQGRLGLLTGAGQGTRMETLDPHGESIPHQVGRGVLVQ